ncbi:hypothetical protein ACFL34_02930 [Candidatus Sumerlaeota bacterium]
MNANRTRMYSEAQTWNPFKGCNFDCSYCIPSFQLQAKRQMHNCSDCYSYAPHYHPERLTKIPSSEIVFVCGNGDIAFCKKSFVREIIQAIKEHNLRCPYKTYYFQSKRPECFAPFLDEFPSNVILLMTLETNRDEGYEQVSKTAPLPSERYQQFRSLAYSRKVVTVEPVMDFDLMVFSKWLIGLRPEHIYLGFNSRPKSVVLPEPSEAKVRSLMAKLSAKGIKVKGKELRGTEV